jgi:hypothetical protein
LYKEESQLKSDNRLPQRRLKIKKLSSATNWRVTKAL